MKNGNQPNITTPFNDSDQLANAVLYNDWDDYGPYKYPYLPWKIYDNNGDYLMYLYDKLGRLQYTSPSSHTAQWTMGYSYSYSRDEGDFDPTNPNCILIDKR